MNRTERLYAVTEELRRAGAAGTTGARLASLLEVSERTIKRDISALQQAGALIWAQTGPGGGYVLDGSASLPPVNFSPSQAVAVAVALATMPPGSPFAVDGAAARGKVFDALGPGDRRRAEALAARVWLALAYGDGAPGDGRAPADAAPGDVRAPRRGGPTRPEQGAEPGVLRAVEQALSRSHVLSLRYRAGSGEVTRRLVEPIVLAFARGRWYLVAWCRSREAVRSFRLARIERADVTSEVCVPRPVAEVGTPPADAAPVLTASARSPAATDPGSV